MSREGGGYLARLKPFKISLSVSSREKFGNEDILFFFTFLSLEVEVPRCEVFRVNEIDG